MIYFLNRLAARILPVALLLALMYPATPAFSAPIVIKMATLVPEGSSWFEMLRGIGNEWEKISGGQVTLRIYPGGVAGDEDAMIRKMKIGQIQAAAITGMGLAYLEKSFFALHIPMMYGSDEEFDYVRSRYAPVLEKKLADKGFIVLNWGDAGWIHFFTTSPVSTPDEAKKLKLFMSSSGGDPTLLELYKEVGFRPVPLPINDLLPGLQTGMVNGYNATPLVSLAFQWFGLAPNMIDLRWAPLTGATVIEKKTWEKIPADMREKLLEASRVEGEKLHVEVRRLNEEAIKVMIKHGMKVHKVSPDVHAQWRKMVEDVHPKVRGGIMPTEAFDAVKKFRDEYRAEIAAGKSKGGQK
ncbi:MAG: TRAP transporter substrate-binding protein DctP [Syntrophorhabdaceae bacterium]|nr:TRAP transporter substrate-binding protein DctP [Syntrophorhabdaceae bacterium]